MHEEGLAEVYTKYKYIVIRCNFCPSEFVTRLIEAEGSTTKLVKISELFVATCAAVQIRDQVYWSETWIVRIIISRVVSYGRFNFLQ